MADQMHFELVTPERRLLDMHVAHVVVPGAEGDFGVLPGHAPVISTVRPGLIEIFETEPGEAKRLFLKGGFAEVGPDGLVVLAEDAIDPASVDRAQLETEIRNAGEDLADAGDDRERARLEKELAWRQALLAIIAT
ncbi:MAG: F0F1 ATP synthase subunit epsilon [Alphaproteobacteria bacterium]|nr:MAG: F0F1 ATP synthase subunit epsilon [Alphaproteobacteria bacterium]